jgi:hypothetical protein
MRGRDFCSLDCEWDLDRVDRCRNDQQCHPDAGADFEMRLSSSLVVQGADAMLADGITGNLKAASEREGSLGIECFFQCELMCIADGRMEEAGADTPIHFDYG